MSLQSDPSTLVSDLDPQSLPTFPPIQGDNTSCEVANLQRIKTESSLASFVTLLYLVKPYR
jgi:hypothetical protein